MQGNNITVIILLNLIVSTIPETKVRLKINMLQYESYYFTK